MKEVPSTSIRMFSVRTRNAIVTALLLYQFGTGPVKGFAVTLTLGTLASMVTAIFVTRTFFMIWLERRPNMTTLSI